MRIDITGNKLTMLIVVDSNADQRRYAMEEWHSAALRQAIPPLIAKGKSIVGRDVSKWSVRRMKTK